MRPRLATSKEPAGCSTVQYSPVYLVNRVSKPYKDPPALAYFSLSSERCDVVMQPHHRREGLFGRHRRPGPGALRRGPGGGAQAVRGPQACLGDATGRLRALNGHSCHPFFGPRNGPRCPHHPWVECGCNVGPPPPLPPPTLPRSASPSRVSPSTPAKMSVRVWFSFACSATFVLGSASTYSSFLLRTTCLRPIERSLRRYRLRCS